MGIFWEAVDDEIQFFSRIFLAIFVLIALIPFIQKSFTRLHDFILSLRRLRAPGIAASMTEPDSASAEPRRMGEVEYLVFRRLAQTPPRGAPVRALAAALHLDPALVRRSLEILHRKGLVRVVPGLVLGRRFSLSGQGWSMAMAEGLAPKLSVQKGRGGFL